MNSKSNIVSGIVLLILVAGYGLVINPMRAERQGIQSEIAVIEGQVNALQADLDNLNRLDDDLPEDSVSRQKLMSQAPEGLNQSELIKGLNNIATENGITLHAINFDRQGEDSEIKGLKKITMAASFTGVYQDLIDFLQGVEASNRAMSVKSMNLQRNGSAITFNLNIEAYYQ